MPRAHFERGAHTRHMPHETQLAQVREAASGQYAEYNAKAAL